MKGENVAFSAFECFFAPFFSKERISWMHFLSGLFYDLCIQASKPCAQST